MRVIEAVAETCWDDLSEQQREQLSLSTWASGFRVQLPTQTIPIARAASLVEQGPSVRSTVAQWALLDPPSTATTATAFDGVDDELSAGILGKLADVGVKFIGGGGSCR